jgi:RND family efflux transporter MFP subunit
LTPKATDRLGIRTAAVDRRPVQRRRAYGGELMVPAGGAIAVTAPISGTLAAPTSGRIPSPGTRVAKGDEILKWLPLLSPEREVLTPAERVRLAEARASLATSQVEAKKQVDSARVQLEAAELALSRAEQLLKDKAGSQRAVDEARAQVSLARETLAGAEARHELLAKTNLEAEGGKLSWQPLTAPVSGTLRRIDVTADQTVTAGTVLFEIIQHERLWVRVPVFVGQAPEIDPAGSALVRQFGQQSVGAGQAALPITAPPSADPNAATIDFFYELDNPQRDLQPGQKVSVTLPLRGAEESLVIPWSAVLHDVLGSAWVYEQTAPNTFVRRRVAVQYVDDSQAVLAAGPEPRTTVVVEGVAELFGTEFGIGK